MRRFMEQATEAEATILRALVDVELPPATPLLGPAVEYCTVESLREAH